ncbi:MAG: hypothetical protein V5A47_04185 [Bacteroidales bacterium]|nr:hypothetical protein [Bacteroidales bacterium]MBS3775093.1 hypothetical protein [Bacteroidales bacterium]
MNSKNTHIDERTRELLKNTGVEKTGTDFTRKVMSRVEKEKKLHPYKQDNTLWHILLAVVLPVMYFLYQIFTGSESFLAELDLTLKFQPYIQLFQLLADKLVMDVSTPVVPLGILAIVMLLAFDRFILRSLSFK